MLFRRGSAFLRSTHKSTVAITNLYYFYARRVFNDGSLIFNFFVAASEMEAPPAPKKKRANEAKAPKETQKRATTKKDELQIFAHEFLTYNKSAVCIVVLAFSTFSSTFLERENDLRNLRRKIGVVEKNIEEANYRVDQLKLKLDKAYSKAPNAKRLAFEKERQILIWCREIVCILDKAGLLGAECDLDYNSTPETIIRTLEEAQKSTEMHTKLQNALAGTVLEIF